MKQFSTFLLALIAVFTCKAQDYPLTVVENVDLIKYSGLWYEIASFPQRFQKGCKCTTAEYLINNDHSIKVINTCTKPDKITQIMGKASVVPGSGNAKLKVQFFWPFKGDYWIVELDHDYQWAAVGNKDRKYLWILSRTPIMSDLLFTEICIKLHKKGFDISNLQKTVHDCY